MFILLSCKPKEDREFHRCCWQAQHVSYDAKFSGTHRPSNSRPWNAFLMLLDQCADSVDFQEMCVKDGSHVLVSLLVKLRNIAVPLQSKHAVHITWQEHTCVVCVCVAGCIAATI